MSLPALSGLHHVTLPVADLERSADWYATVLRGERVARMDHHDSDGALSAVVLRLPGLTVPVKLQLVPGIAGTAHAYDPVTFGVADEAELDRWVAHLDAHAVPHSPVAAARIGHAVTCTDPDGTLLRFYTEPVADLDDVPLPPNRGVRR